MGLIHIHVAGGWSINPGNNNSVSLRIGHTKRSLQIILVVMSSIEHVHALYTLKLQTGVCLGIPGSSADLA